ncbi:MULTISPECIES: hypothetical protein [Niveibacterium]|uniref:DUF4157 domain-containing protein n=1 Tax=Niveibacterium microcysteis TaxID=2811415 RepID=A0ABX7MA03_9RHOO|nr:MULTISPECIES: hypothetical protein [Niveibacterium]QSI77305.1 hypothetical protein JY500_01230 [Niveibacterium microcysteis]
MRTRVALGCALLLLAACGGEQWVRLSPEEQQKLATPGIRINAIAEQATPVIADLLAATEAEVLINGRPLSEAELAMAQTLGIAAPQKIRIEVRRRFPMPEDPRMANAARELGLIFGTDDEAGRTQGYAILLKPEFANSRRLISHELVHVAQYERLGGIAPYARQYLVEMLALGYSRAPLEQEAYARQITTP